MTTMKVRSIDDDDEAVNVEGTYGYYGSFQDDKFHNLFCALFVVNDLIKTVSSENEDFDCVTPNCKAQQVPCFV